MGIKNRTKGGEPRIAVMTKLDPHIHKKVAQLAQSEDRSISGQVRRLVIEAIERTPHQQEK
jgi:hypothetical protein